MPFLQAPQPQPQDKYTYQRPTETESIGLLIALGYRPYLFYAVSGAHEVLVWSKTLYQDTLAGRETDTLATRRRILSYMGAGSINRLRATLADLRPWFDGALVIFETPEKDVVLMQLGEGVWSARGRSSAVGLTADGEVRYS